jgi:sporulation protein YlmC with PRC-barrel domain
MMRLNELAGTEVVDESGKHLGRLVDLRCRHENPLPSVVDELVFGEVGWLERLGLRAVRERTCPWSAVRSFNARRIVVAA